MQAKKLFRDSSEFYVGIYFMIGFLLNVYFQTKTEMNKDIPRRYYGDKQI